MIKILSAVLLAVAATVIFLLSSSHADPIAEGAEAPKLTVTDQDGKTFDLASVYAKGFTVVYFYPKADTPGCTKQACSLRDAFTQLSDKGVSVIGVSTDKPEAQKAFKEKYKLPFTLVADPEAVLVKAFGVPVMNIGLATRQAYLVNQQGKIVWRSLKASTDQQAADVLAAMAAMSPASPAQ
jgi:thioredoxin-dependent peroxiredoxin